MNKEEIKERKRERTPNNRTTESTVVRSYSSFALTEKNRGGQDRICDSLVTIR